ncbi:MAG: polysaccharide lyase family protein [Opitutaceae bacterium]
MKTRIETTFGAVICAFAATALFCSPAHAAAAGGAVTITEDANLYTLDNGIVTARVAKASGDLVSLRYKDQEMLATFLKPDGMPDLEKDPPGMNHEGLNRGMTDHQYGFWSHDAMGPKNTLTAEPKITIDPKANGGARGEVSVKGLAKGRKMGTGPGSNANGQFEADVEIRFALERGAQGVYTYSIFEHKPEYATTTLGEARVAFKLADSFDWMLADEHPKRNKLYPKTLRENKYNYTTVQSENPAFGWASTTKNVGFFIVNPVMEYMSGGPTKVEFLVHRDTNSVAAPTVLNYWRSSHYGGANVTVAAGEQWTKVVGPILVYVNSGTDPQAMRRDAIAQQRKESSKWPYDWVKGVDFPSREQRSTVSGQLVLKDAGDPKAKMSAVRVGLTHAAYEIPAATAPGAGGGARQIDWQEDAKFYQFWAKGEDNGKFSIPHVRPGSYTLHAIADGVLGEYTKANVVVQAGKGLDLSKLEWTPVRRGKQLWEIGIPNRNAREFFKGDDFFHDGMPVNFAKLFPNGINYVVGKSDFRKDWYYQHVPHAEAEAIKLSDEAIEAASRPRPAVVTPPPAPAGAQAGAAATPARGRGPAAPAVNGGDSVRTITFDVPSAPRGGKATLRLAISGVGARTLDVALNNQPVGGFATLRADSTFGMGNGIQGLWHEREVAFDAKLLKAGTNTISLTVKGGPVAAGIMYDYLRLELDESAQASLPTPSPAYARN